MEMSVLKFHRKGVGKCSNIDDIYKNVVGWFLTPLKGEEHDEMEAWFKASKREIRNALEQLVNLYKSPQNVPLDDANEVVSVLHEKKIRIFFSYKQNEKSRADKVKRELEELLNQFGKVEIISDSGFSEGKKITPEVVERISECQWFILLLPDPSEEWDWQLFESGVFSYRESSKLNKVFILHHEENTRPDQFSNTFTIAAHPGKQEKVYEWLKKNFCTDNSFPGMGALCTANDSLVQNAARNINEAIAPPRLIVKEYCAPYIKIHFPCINEVVKPPDDDWEARKKVDEKNRMLLDKAVILKSNPKSNYIFGWETPQQTTWGGYIENVMQVNHDNRWVSEICTTMLEASLGKIVESPIQATFQSLKNNIPYRPIVYLAEKVTTPKNGTRSQSDRFYILFIEDVTFVADLNHQSLGKVHDGYEQVWSSQRHSYRFAWEIVEPFKNIESTDQIKALDLALSRVEQEYQSRSKHKLHELANYFENDSERVKALYVILKDTLSKLEELIADGRSLDKIRQLLREFEPINLEYLSISSDWIARQNKAHWENIKTKTR